LIHVRRKSISSCPEDSVGTDVDRDLLLRRHDWRRTGAEVNEVGPAPVDFDRAADWVRDSLAQGSEFSIRVARRLSDLPQAIVIGPPLGDSQVLDGHGRGISQVDADVVLDRVVDALALTGVKTLVVEDDLARRGDPSLHGQVAFVGGRVLRWADLSRAKASRLVRTGASGYPLNAFVCRADAISLSLTPERELSEADAVALAHSVCAVVTSVYDAESFVILGAADLWTIVGSRC